MTKHVHQLVRAQHYNVSLDHALSTEVKTVVRESLFLLTSMNNCRKPALNAKKP
jgi:hypothetical protein|tara:strand:+ start:429 stop:590 length:162 start_codon:yes stop_codon:yes gene_type:complete